MTTDHVRQHAPLGHAFWTTRTDRFLCTEVFYAGLFDGPSGEAVGVEYVGLNCEDALTLDEAAARFDLEGATWRPTDRPFRAMGTPERTAVALAS